jgi:hypothetical protein
MAACIVEDCERPNYGHGYCKMHWKRWWRTGSPDIVRQVAVPPREFCEIPGCGKPHAARGYCNKHWARWRRTGDPLTVRKAPNGTGDSYALAHMKVRDTRGTPQRCEHCGERDGGHRRYQWALDYENARAMKRDAVGWTYSMDPDDYIRLCVSCHKLFDLKAKAS